MASFTVHIKRQPANADAARERAVFVRDGWNWGAFGFGPFWMLARGHVLFGLLTLALQYGGLAGLVLAGIRPDAVLGIVLALGVTWGLEGASLRRLALRLFRYEEAALVVASAEDEAERRFYDTIPETEEPAARLSPATFVPHGTGNPVMGLFPQSRGSA